MRRYVWERISTPTTPKPSALAAELGVASRCILGKDRIGLGRLGGATTLFRLASKVSIALRKTKPGFPRNWMGGPFRPFHRVLCFCKIFVASAFFVHFAPVLRRCRKGAFQAHLILDTSSKDVPAQLRA